MVLEENACLLASPSSGIDLVTTQIWVMGHVNETGADNHNGNFSDNIQLSGRFLLSIIQCPGKPE